MEKIYLADYLRLSMEDGDIVSNLNKAESDSIACQRELIAQYRRDKKLYPGAEVLEFVDDGYSGTNFDRPAVKQMLSLIRERKICCVIVKDFSRFGRNYLEVSDYLEQIFPFLGIRFISINDGYDSDEYVGTTGGIEIALKNLLYDMYSKDLSVKMRTALEIRRKRGDFIGPRPPFGYVFSENRRGLKVDSTSAQYVKRVFELACMGHSTGEIAKRLNEEKIPTPGQYKNRKKMQYHIMEGAGCWNSKAVRNILENKVYLGMTVNGKFRVTNVGGKQFKRVADEEQICVSDRHEAIISEQVFKKAAMVIRYRGNQRGKAHQYKRDSILTGKLRCGNCKRSLVRITCTEVPCFACERPNYDKACGCFRGRVTEPEIEAFVWEQIKKRQKLFGQTTDLSKQTGIADGDLTESRNQDLKKLKALEQRKASLKTEKLHFYEQMKRGIMDQKAYSRQVEVLRAEENRLDEEIRQLREEKNTDRMMQEDKTASDGVEKLSREIVERFIENIYVYEEEQFDVVWKR